MSEETPAGRGLDAQVEEIVMGQERLSCHAGDCFLYIKIINGKEKKIKRQAPFYSTSIADAWLVVEKMTDKYPDTFFTLEFQRSHTPQWLADFGEAACADTAPLAICRAALICVRGNKNGS